MTAFEFQSQLSGLTSFVNHFARKYARNEQDAEDLAQETMLRALANYDKFRTNTNLKGWLRVLMRNIFINGYRRSSMRVVMFDSESFTVQQGETDHYDPVKRMTRDEVEEAITELSDYYKIPFSMHLEGYKYEEIAAELQVPVGTVKSRIFQARKILMELFKHARS